MGMWPAGLPQKFSPDGFEYTPAENTDRTKVDHGPTKSARKGTAEADRVKGRMVITTSQYSIWKTFWTDTVKQGSLPFDWTHPIDESSVEYMFLVNPRITPAGGSNWYLDMDLEIQA